MWQKVLEASDLRSGEIRCILAGERKILVMQSGNAYYACGAICPHQGISMEEGLVFDEEITCPEHSWVFSLRTGELTWPGTGPRIPVYPIRLSEGSIEIFVEN